MSSWSDLPPESVVRTAAPNDHVRIQHEVWIKCWRHAWHIGISQEAFLLPSFLLDPGLPEGTVFNVLCGGEEGTLNL